MKKKKKNKSHRLTCENSNCTEISQRPTAVDIRYLSKTQTLAENFVLVCTNCNYAFIISNSQYI